MEDSTQEEINSRKKARINKRTITLSVLAACLFLLPAGLCCQYALRNRELQGKAEELQAQVEELTAALADRDRIIDAERENSGSLREQLADALSMEEYRTETGFVKKGGVYLIDSESRLRQLRQMIAEDAEIEPGVAAASASYRMQYSMRMSEYWGDWFALGTRERPFSGRFDGEGHTISGKFPLSVEGENVPEAVFRTDSGAQIANLQVSNLMRDSTDTEICVTVYNDGECAELEGYLANFPDCRIRVEMCTWDLDAQGTAGALRERWERNQGQDGYYVSISFYPLSGEKPDENTYCQNILTPLCALAGEEYGELLEEALRQEDGCLRFVRLERIGELTCCSFETGRWEEGYHREGDGYHIILEGKWEGAEIKRQHLFIPYTEMEMSSVGTYQGYRIERVDINFDGKQDLLIHEGYSGGSGGSWSNYRAVVWNGEKGQFEYYPSFPEQLVSLEFDQQRVVSRGRVGVPYEYVTVYGVVNGEYVCTRELVCETVYDEDSEKLVKRLSYYEMGELVRTHILSDYAEKEELYPDMDYWFKG